MVRKSSAARGGHSERPRRAGSGSRRSNGRGGDRARDRSRGAEGVDARIDPVRARRPARGREGDAPEAAALAAPALQGLGDGGPVPGSAQPLDLLAKERVLLRGESSGREGQTAVAGREFESRGRAARARRRDPAGRGVGKSRSGKVLTVDAGCSTSIRLRSRGAPRARVRGRAHLRRPGVLHHLLVLILRVRHRRERSLSGSCARRAREKCDASRLNGGGVDDRRGVVRSTLRLKKAEAKSAFSFAAFERSGVNRLGGVGENPTRSIASRPSFSSRASRFFPATLSDSVGHANPRSRRFPHSKRRFSRESDQDADRRIERSAGCLSGRARPIAPSFDTATRLARGSAPRFSVRAARFRF